MRDSCSEFLAADALSFLPSFSLPLAQSPTYTSRGFLVSRIGINPFDSASRAAAAVRREQTAAARIHFASTERVHASLHHIGYSEPPAERPSRLRQNIADRCDAL